MRKVPSHARGAEYEACYAIVLGKRNSHHLEPPMLCPLLGLGKQRGETPPSVAGMQPELGMAHPRATALAKLGARPTLALGTRESGDDGGCQKCGQTLMSSCVVYLWHWRNEGALARQTMVDASDSSHTTTQGER
jgi:hypothetical protein